MLTRVLADRPNTYRLEFRGNEVHWHTCSGDEQITLSHEPNILMVTSCRSLNATDTLVLHIRWSSIQKHLHKPVKTFVFCFYYRMPQSPMCKITGKKVYKMPLRPVSSWVSRGPMSRADSNWSAVKTWYPHLSKFFKIEPRTEVN